MSITMPGHCVYYNTIEAFKRFVLITLINIKLLIKKKKMERGKQLFVVANSLLQIKEIYHQSVPVHIFIGSVILVNVNQYIRVNVITFFLRVAFYLHTSTSFKFKVKSGLCNNFSRKMVIFDLRLQLHTKIKVFNKQF